MFSTPCFVLVAIHLIYHYFELVMSWLWNQPGFGYQQQLVPGMRPGGGPMPNFFMPMVQQGQQGQRPGGRRAGGVQQNQQPVPMMQQQVSIIEVSPCIPILVKTNCPVRDIASQLFGITDDAKGANVPISW